MSPGTGPQRCHHGAEISMGCAACAEEGRRARLADRRAFIGTPRWQRALEKFQALRRTAIRCVDEAAALRHQAEQLARQLEAFMLRGAEGRLVGYIQEISRHTLRLRFGGRQPIVDAHAWARLALELGLDPWWAVNWIHGGYPTPPSFLQRTDRMSGADILCPHPRQMTPERDLLPCADPACPAAGYAKGSRGGVWRTAVMPDVARLFRRDQSPIPSLGAAILTVEWQRIEWRDEAGASQFFWRRVR